jgi:hypothetical protein
MLKFARRFASNSSIIKQGDLPAQFVKVASTQETYYE